jgi:hypothetical protein
VTHTRVVLQIYEVYEDVLYNTLHHLSDGDVDNDLPTININSALSYVRDAFGISENKHNEIYEKAKSREFPKIQIDKNTLSESDEGNLTKNKLNKIYGFTPNINNFEALEAHCCLTKILLKHQLESSQTPHFYWDGKFSFLARSVLLQHSESKCLTDANIAFGQWAAYAEVHKQHPLNLAVFIEKLGEIVDICDNGETTIGEKNLLVAAKVFIPSCFGLAPTLRSIKEPIVLKSSYDKLNTKDELVVKMFWNGAKILSDSFVLFIGKLYEKNDSEIEILIKTFEIMNKIKKIESSENSMNIKFLESIKESITGETSKYLSQIINRKSLKNKNNEVRIRKLINVMTVANADFVKLIETYGSVFEE